jgi:hypothetical protein
LLFFKACISGQPAESFMALTVFVQVQSIESLFSIKSILEYKKAEFNE